MHVTLLQPSTSQYCTGQQLEHLIRLQVSHQPVETQSSQKQLTELDAGLVDWPVGVNGKTMYTFGGLAGDNVTPKQLDDLWECKVVVIN